jgi:hypothetical protein
MVVGRSGLISAGRWKMAQSASEQKLPIRFHRGIVLHAAVATSDERIAHRRLQTGMRGMHEMHADVAASNYRR